MIQLRWNASPFEQRGNSMALSTFEAIELHRAELAITKRWRML